MVNLIVKGKHHYPEHFIASSRARMIEGHTFWAYSWNKISKWNLNTLSAKTIPIDLPMSGQWYYQNDTSRFWIASDSKLFSFDKQTEEVHQYPLAAMDSLGLQQAQSFSKYVEKSRWLEGQFEPFLAIHPVQEHLRLAHNIWEYEPFRDTFADALATQEIAPGLLEHNFFTLLRRLANDGKIERVLFLDSLYRDTHEKALGSNSSLFRMYSFGINELRTLQSTRDSLKNVAESEERYYFQEAVLFLGICRTGWYGGFSSFLYLSFR